MDLREKFSELEKKGIHRVEFTGEYLPCVQNALANILARYGATSAASDITKPWWTWTQEDTVYDPVRKFTGQSGDEHPVKYSGRFMTRLAKLVKKADGISLGENTTNLITNLLSTQKSPIGSYMIDYTHLINWNAGEFGDHGSCWWGKVTGKTTYAKAFERMGGMAIRLWSDMAAGMSATDARRLGLGRGRAWVMAVAMPCSGYAVFNGYVDPNYSQEVSVPDDGSLDYDTKVMMARTHDLSGEPVMSRLFAKIMALELGVGWNRMQVENNANLYWINSSSAYIVSDEEPRGSVIVLDRHASRIIVTGDGHDVCSFCEEPIVGDAIYDAGGNSLCQSCYNSSFSNCEGCNLPIRTEDSYSHELTSGVFCSEDCRDSWEEDNVYRCESCEDLVLRDESFIVENNTLCESCYENYVYRCDNCDDEFFAPNGPDWSIETNARSCVFCRGSCHENYAYEHLRQCACCEEYMEKDDAIEVEDDDGVYLCDPCFTDDAHACDRCGVYTTNNYEYASKRFCSTWCRNRHAESVGQDALIVA